jgi:hypothetical protein
MAGLKLYQEQLPLLYPSTFAALQMLVMSMADCTNNAGKKTWFGRDKGTESLIKFHSNLKRTIFAMMSDGMVRDSDGSELFYEKLIKVLHEFSLAFPNWNDAYSFANIFFLEGNRRDESIKIIAQLRANP